MEGGRLYTEETGAWNRSSEIHGSKQVFGFLKNGAVCVKRTLGGRMEEAWESKTEGNQFGWGGVDNWFLHSNEEKDARERCFGRKTDRTGPLAAERESNWGEVLVAKEIMCSNQEPSWGGGYYWRGQTER